MDNKRERRRFRNSRWSISAGNRIATGLAVSRTAIDVRDGVNRRATLKLALQIAGVAALLVGMLWIGQGTGVVRWPASSFMVDQRPWALRGALLVLIGGLLLWRSTRR